VATEAELPGLYHAPPAPSLERVSAPAGLIEASTGFLEAWLLRKDYETAWRSLAPSCRPCVDLFLGEGESPAGSPAEQARRLRSKMEEVGRRLRPAARLEEVLTAAPGVDADDKVVAHPREKAFTLLSLSDQVGRETDCGRRLGGTPAGGDPVPKSYGTYYASAFHFRTAAGQPAVLYLGWRREGPDWRVVAYDVLTP